MGAQDVREREGEDGAEGAKQGVERVVSTPLFFQPSLSSPPISASFSPEINSQWNLSSKPPPPPLSGISQSKQGLYEWKSGPDGLFSILSISQQCFISFS